ncbi:MAG: type II toxin-antitoxin system MqsA family antitoxin [Ruminococcus sp.]|nr:type II toxin-antitoxin system MqsA family antitoxin [Ruminococcus sp.]
MKCIECGGEYTESTKSHVVDSESLIIIRNVPCLECNQCGDTVYTDTVIRRLDEIIDSLKSFLGEIAVVDYSDNQAA